MSSICPFFHRRFSFFIVLPRLSALRISTSISANSRCSLLISWGMRDMELSKQKKSPELTTNRPLRAEIWLHGLLCSCSWAMPLFIFGSWSPGVIKWIAGSILCAIWGGLKCPDNSANQINRELYNSPPYIKRRNNKHKSNIKIAINKGCKCN